MPVTPHLTRLGPDEVYPVMTRDGSVTLYSRAFSTTYHSLYGAVGESRHVFIQQGLMNLLPKTDIRILEFGFGTGLNAFLSYLFSLRHQVNISYTGLEAFPIDENIAGELDYPGYLCAEAHREVFLQMHKKKEFRQGTFEYFQTNGWTDIPLRATFDCIFLDAFSPVVQGELWEQDIFDELFRRTALNGCLVTYCAQGEVRRRMVKAGYRVVRLPGPPGKREMLRAEKKADSEEVMD